MAVVTLGLFAIGCLSSCQEVEFDVNPAVLQEHVFEQSFIKEFGKPSPDQTWDFYARKMASLQEGAVSTRATAATTVKVENATQPIGQAYFDSIVSQVKLVLEDEIDNSHVGQNHYSLTSTGTFNIYAILYAGDYQKQSKYGMDFGIAYKNEYGRIQTKNLFGYKNGNGEFNPGYAKKVTITEGDPFFFYLKLRPGGKTNSPTYTYYSNSTTFTRSDNTSSFNLKDKYGIVHDGPSTLAYSMEVNTAAQGDKQIMILGFEDGWSGDADVDYNDIVIVLEGNLPVITSKRFFAEDKESLDWDYNDVVFDVSNTGIVLRAVGGTLPVWLRVKNRLPNSTAQIVSVDGISELHELMRYLQHQTSHQQEVLTYERDVIENGERKRKTFYKPIDVGANPGLWLDPVQILKWTWSADANKSTRLEEGEVERFANPFVENPLGDIQLLVGSEYGQSYEDAVERLPLDNDPSIEKLDLENYQNRPRLVELSEKGGIPAIWSAPVSVHWMAELKKITRAYPGFYGDGTIDSQSNMPMWWEVDPINRDYLYEFGSDVDPDAH
ncbi:MAG: hypothetical protein J5543_07990 [Bacteroidales bacterium]|nr:hypothetical protein [Bacteroidales bacterium]